MSSYDKVVKLACKPKAAPPKAKYLDPIIAATWDDGGAVHDVCRALSPRFREPNAIIVFKALIVLHTMIRNGSTDNVLSYLSGSQVLRLHNVSAGNWDGYSPPENLQNYAAYMEARIHAYRDLKHDAIKVQSDTNRDARTTAAVNGTPNLQRSKTLTGRKLRSMTVEKGLLRETRAVHRMIDTLVACRFYLDDLEDQLTLTALRMLVKDLLILFQAGNEGVINLLEHYFEMSHVDATEALTIYRHFCAQTELVVEYLGVARKLQNLLNVPVPNLKHAPVSLAGALQEYLDDPQFEQNRIEYKTNKEATRRGGKGAPAKSETPPVPALPASASSSSAPKPDASATNGNGSANGAKTPDVLVDFFAAIEDTQPTMFNPTTNSPNTAYFQQNAQNPNPFQRMQAQATGFPQQQGAFGPQPTGAFQNQAFQVPNGQPQLQLPQQTGMFGMQPQATGFNPFQRPMSTVGPLTAQATGMGMGAFGQPTGAFQQSQPTIGGGGLGVGLRPQMTGGAANPFRASAYGNVAVPPPMMTGMGSLSAGPTFGGGAGVNPGAGVGNMGAVSQPPQQQPPFLRPHMTGGAGAANPFRASMMFSQGTGPAALSGFGSNSSSVPAVPPFALGNNNNGVNAGGAAGIPRPASAPLSALAPSQTGSGLQPVKTHQTGTRNPFGQPAPRPEEVPPVPKQPTLMEIAMGTQQQQFQQFQQQQQQQQEQQQQIKTQATGFGGSTTKAFDYSQSALGPGETDISSVASEFTFNKSGGGANGLGSSASNTTGTSNAGSSLFGSFTGTTSSLTGTSSSPSLSSSFSPPFGASSGSFSPTVSAFNPANSALNSGAPTTGTSSPLTTQPMGSAVKAFKPSSSFGASLLEALPSIPGSAPATPAVTGSTPSSMNAQQTGFFGAGGSMMSPTSGASPANSMGGFGMGSSPGGGFGGAGGTSSTGAFGGSSLGVGLRPQMTGGAANPFRASMAMPPMGTMPTGAGPMSAGGMPGQAGAFGPMPTGQTGAFGGGASLFGGGAFGSGSPAFGNPQQGQQQQQNASLI